MTRRKSPKKQGNRNRFLSPTKLYDDEGRLWECVATLLPRAQVEHLVNQAGVRMGIHSGATTVRWVPIDERRSAWLTEIQPNFVEDPDDPSWKPPPGTPGQQPYVGTLWRHGDNQLLLFDDLD
jgi:hypothetical protein